ncbi:hypothetical protein PLESTM_001788800 [Pleodorina starrii]|nr:hypothetical protein PLESTM_001788800 [Pleodorina starrii]
MLFQTNGLFSRGSNSSNHGAQPHASRNTKDLLGEKRQAPGKEEESIDERSKRRSSIGQASAIAPAHPVIGTALPPRSSSNWQPNFKQSGKKALGTAQPADLTKMGTQRKEAMGTGKPERDRESGAKLSGTACGSEQNASDTAVTDTGSNPGTSAPIESPPTGTPAAPSARRPGTTDANGTSQVRARQQQAEAASVSAPGAADLDGLEAEFEGSAHPPPVKPAKGQPPQMRGRLRARATFWQTFCRSALVLNWVLFGFSLRWLEKTGPPAPIHLRNHASATEQSAFVDAAIEELIATGAARAVNHQPRCVLPLGVVPKKGTTKFRLIYDARYINEHLQVPSFMYESLATLGDTLERDDYMFTVDLKSGYHHVDMHESAWEFLGFEWKGRWFQFVQLPFGLAPACWVFTKITRELQQSWRAEGHRCSGYIDDSIHAHQDKQVLTQLRTRVLTDFESAGFLVSESKCSLEPEQRKTYLGAEIDTVRGSMFVPASKRVAVQALAREVLQAHDGAREFRIRGVASLAGSLLSMSHSFGKISILMTRLLSAWVADELRQKGTTYDSYRLLTPDVAWEVKFWVESFEHYDGFRPIWRPSHVHSFVIYTDAAGRSEFSFGGWGGWTKEDGVLLIASGQWEKETDEDSSTLLELTGMLNVLQSFNGAGRLDDQHVLVRTDSRPSRDILTKGGSVRPRLQGICSALLWYCIERGIDLLVEWVPRDLNQFADDLSKHQESCDWKLNPCAFGTLAAKWGRGGQFAVDLFASAHNYQMQPFYSYHFHPASAGVNAFAVQWPQAPDIAWCNPPFAVLGRVLAHAEACKARLCLLAPFWPRAAWWPRLVTSGSLFREFVHAVHVFPTGPGLFLQNRLGVWDPVPPPTWQSMALLLDFGAANSRCLPIPPL